MVLCTIVQIGIREIYVIWRIFTSVILPVWGSQVQWKEKKISRTDVLVTVNILLAPSSPQLYHLRIMTAIENRTCAFPCGKLCEIRSNYHFLSVYISTTNSFKHFRDRQIFLRNNGQFRWYAQQICGIEELGGVLCGWELYEIIVKDILDQRPVCSERSADPPHGFILESLWNTHPLAKLLKYVRQMPSLLLSMLPLALFWDFELS